MDQGILVKNFYLVVLEDLTKNSQNEDPSYSKIKTLPRTKVSLEVYDVIAKIIIIIIIIIINKQIKIIIKKQIRQNNNNNNNS